MAEFLLEIFSEEIPARMQARAAEDMNAHFTRALEEAGLAFDRIEAFATPRRLALVVDGLPERQPDRTQERKGPKVGAPEKAMEGFLKSTGLALDQCEQRDTPKGPVWFAVMNMPGEPTPAVLADIIAGFMREYRWPMSMKWASHELRWVRPLQGILALFDGKGIEGEISLGNGGTQPFTNLTMGHRFLSGDAFEVQGFSDYREKLRRAHVLLDPSERQDIIRTRAAALAEEAGLSLRADEDLVAENAGLTEWPVPMMGVIDDRFMDVPPEVLITSMKTHQRYFAVEKSDGSLAPRFVCTANTEASDGGAAIIAGNERVLRARLADAKFFWDQDRKTRLADRAPGLADITFHADLGTMAEKVKRLQLLAEYIANRELCDSVLATRAAELAKNDLLTGMVGEFPELQGVMGGHYATNDREPAAVAQAIADHYSPLGPNDRCPSAAVSIAVALADKIDTIAGFFSIGEIPTGSRDPFALRRAALGIIRLIVENEKNRIWLQIAFEKAIGYYDKNVDRRSVYLNISRFILDRLRVYLRGKGLRYDIVDAALAFESLNDIMAVVTKVSYLERFLDSADGENLMIAYNRASRIVAIAEKEDGYADSAVDQNLFRQNEERILYSALEARKIGLPEAIANTAFSSAMRDLAGLRAPVDAFFDQVTVNADEADLRRNRLALLRQITETMNSVADFSRIAG